MEALGLFVLVKGRPDVGASVAQSNEASDVNSCVETTVELYKYTFFQEGV